MGKFIKIATTIIVLGGLVFLLGFAETRYHGSALGTVAIEVNVPGADTLILNSEIRELILKEFDSLEGKPVSSINIEEIEKTVGRVAWLNRVDAAITVNGNLRLTAGQCLPVMRVMNGKSQSFYVDETGFILPVRNSFPVYVPLVSPAKSWNIDLKSAKRLDELDIPELEEAFELVMAMRQVGFTRELVDQIHVDKEGEFILVPKVPGPVILLGDTSRLKEKFGNLYHVFKTILPARGWDHYKTINLKYERQVICST